MKPHLSYIICTTPRSGSWLLWEGLHETRLAGIPREWFNDEGKALFCGEWGIPLPGPDMSHRSYLDSVIAAGTTPNGVFGMTCHFDQFELLLRALVTIPEYRGMPLPQAIRDAFPDLRFIWLTRRSKIRQAISYHRAKQTDLWRIREGDSLSAPPPVSFDAGEIARWERNFTAKDAHWQKYFHQFGIAPMAVYYEDFIAQYAATIRQALAFLGIAQDVPVAPPQLRQMADATTEEWVRRYQQDRQNAAAGG